MENTPVVNAPVTTENKVEEPINNGVVNQVQPTTAPGSKTDSELLLKSLQEEREKRRLAEEKLKEYETPPVSDVFSDEGRAIVEKYVTPLQQTVESLQDQLVLKDLYNAYPDLKGLSSEFDEFRKDYPRHKLDNVAKLFLTEKGMLDTPRKGLEKPTGGVRTPISTGMTHEDIKNLRETNYRKYQDMLMKGLIKVE